MNENPEPQPDPQPSPQPPQEPAPGGAPLAAEAAPDYRNRRASDANPIKRRLVASLAALYAVSVIAATVLLWRSQAAKPADDGNGKGEGLGAAKRFLASVSQKDAVAVVEINGAIYRAEGGKLFEKGAAQLARRIEKLAAKDEVKAIVLLINSPGGSVGAVQEIHSALGRVKAKHKKPIVAHLGDVAASGGYYLAAACDKIIAHPGTLVGSIGVIFSNSNVEALLDKIGVKIRVIKSGKMKDIGSMTRAMTEEERALLQALIDNAYGQFLKAVVDGRRLPVEKIRPLADGRIFSGEQGLENGLVDSLGDSQDAILLAAKLGGIKDEKPRVIRGDAGSLQDVLELLESRLSLRSGELELLREVSRIGYTGLEYRWAR